MRGLAKSQSSAIADEPGSYWGHLLPMPESSDLSLMTDKVGKGWFSMLCHRLVWCTDAAVARADDVG